jgi:putative DNA primase/helicase
LLKGNDLLAGRPPRIKRANPELFENIPTCLKELNQWVVWRLHLREDGKPAKVPMDPKMYTQPASVTNPETWGTFAEAVACFATDSNRVKPVLAGIGFVFTSADPFTGVDVDECRDAETGEVADWGAAIVQGLDSYAEVSPSGTGVKLIVRAVAPGVETRRNKVEIYSTARYFTLTGHVLLPGLQVQERQAKLDELYAVIFGEVRPTRQVIVEESQAQRAEKLARVRAIPDEELLTLAREAANGAKFQRLWNGDVQTDYGGDHSRADMAICCVLAYWTRADKERMDRLFRRSKLLRPKWDQRRGAMTYGERTVAEAAMIVPVAFDPDLGANPTRNDLGNSDVFIRLAGENFRYVREWKMWLGWDGVCWRLDAAAELRLGLEKVSGELMQAARLLIQAQAEDGPRAWKWALNAGDRSRLAAMDEVLQSRLAIDQTKLDKQPLRLACGNGVLDLREATITEGRRVDWLTRGTNVRYLPTATCPRFEAFLNEIMLGDAEMVAYLWRVIGYCLTGDTRERVFFLLHGNGRNGKTTFVNVLQNLLDRYAQIARFDTFLRKKFVDTGANADIAHLVGARVVIASEADDVHSLDAETVKGLTGDDFVRARFLYGREFQFKPSFKLLLVTNHVPNIRDESHALWDRLHYLPFNYRVSTENCDKQLGLKLMGELEGILAKAVEACLAWQREGLRPPATVLKGVEELRQDMDPMAEAFAQLVEPAEHGTLIHARLYEAYQAWCRENGVRYPVTSRQLIKAIKSKGYELKEGTAHSRIWPGLRMRLGGEQREI